MEVLYKYIGNGAFVVGLPARDILVSETEYHELCEANSKGTLPCWIKVEAATKASKRAKEAVVEQESTAKSTD